MANDSGSKPKTRLAYTDYFGRTHWVDQMSREELIEAMHETSEELLALRKQRDQYRDLW